MIRDWLQLRRRVGINPATPLPSQEGQLRYVRADGAAGVLYLALGAADESVAWADVRNTSHTHTGSATLFAYQSKDSGFSALSTTLATVDSVAIGPLANGVTYDIICEVHMRLSVDSTGYARAYARIGSDSSVMGNQTGSIGGERSCRATATKSAVVGDGSTSYTLYARADMDTDTGTVSSCHIRGMAIPRNV